MSDEHTLKVPRYTEDINKKWLETVIQRHYNENEITINGPDEIHGEQFSKMGEHFASSMTSFDFTITRGNGTEEKLHLIAKLLPNHPALLQMIEKLKLREAIAYSEVLRALDEYARTKSENHPFTIKHPESIYAGISGDGEISAILMKNLKPEGFKMANVIEGVNYDHLHLAVTELARYHAAAKSYEKDQGKMFEDMYKELQKDTYSFDEGPDDLKIMTMKMKQCIEVLKEENMIGLAEKVQKFHEQNSPIEGNFGDALRECSHNTPFSFLCHGDYWLNNMLFKYDETEGRTPIDVRIVDWQVIRRESAASDFGYFIYSATRRDSRKKYFDKLVKLYIETLHSTFRNFGHDELAKECTLEQMEKDIEYLRKWHVCFAICLLPTLMEGGMPEDEKEFDKMNFTQETMERMEKEMKAKISPEMKEKIRTIFIECAEELDELGYL